MPLRALLNGEYYWAENLTEYDRDVDFECPICRSPFIVVLPKEDIIKHFRHKSGREHWEPETPEHLKMKQTVYKISLSLGFEPDLEVTVLDQVIADVFLKYNGINIAVECQCSNLSVDEFLRKDSFYLSHKILPLWLFGGEYFRHTQQFFLHERKAYEPDSGRAFISHAATRAYKIQRIKKLEAEILAEYERNRRRLYYFGNEHFFVGDFQFRWNAETLGWYKLCPIFFTKILSLEENRWNAFFNIHSLKEFT